MLAREIAYFSLAALVACTPGHESPVRSVTVAFSGFGCETECPNYAICVDSTLNVGYYGGRSTERRGYFQGLVSDEQWDSVQVRFAGFLEHGMDTTSFGRTDHPDFEMIVTGLGRDLHVDNNTGNLTDADQATLYWVMGLIERATELQTVDTMGFATSSQYRYQTMLQSLPRP